MCLTPTSHRYATGAINAVVVLQLRNYVDDSQHGTFRALGVVRMGMGGREEEECNSQQTRDDADPDRASNAEFYVS